MSLWVYYVYLFCTAQTEAPRNIGLDLSSELDSQCDLKAIDPIGSMYAIYGNIYHQYTPFMLAYMTPSSLLKYFMVWKLWSPRKQLEGY